MFTRTVHAMKQSHDLVPSALRAGLGAGGGKGRPADAIGLAWIGSDALPHSGPGPEAEPVWRVTDRWSRAMSWLDGALRRRLQNMKS